MSKPFVRSTSNKLIGGVCGGIAEFAGVDATLVRIGMILLTIFAPGPGWLIYPALWLIMPTDDGGPSGFGQLKNWLSQPSERR